MNSKILNNRILLFCVAVLFSICASAQSQSDSTVVHKFIISYPVNETVLYENYLNNSNQLRVIKEYFKKSPRIDRITIYSYASPEGPYNLNRYLAKYRGIRARKYLLDQIHAERNFPDSLVVINHTPENWEGLYKMVNEIYPYDDKQDVIDILNKKGISNDKRKTLLKKLNGGVPWEFIRTNILPWLRCATWVAEWVYVPEIIADLPALPRIEDKFKPIHSTLPYNVLKDPVFEERKKLLFALKTNLIYDALTWFNFSVEVPLYKDKFSLLYYHQFPWWTWGQADNEYCNRFLSIGAEARWWFGTRDVLQGHFLGIYSESGKYDFEYQRSGLYQGEFYTAGLSYGYAMPIGKSLNLEFSLSAGYASIAYRGYNPTDDYELLIRDRNKVGRIEYIGPTKAQISLVIPIKATVRKKGGDR